MSDVTSERVDPGLVRPGGISYLHIPATDVGAAARFYESVFGWDVHGHDSERPGFVDSTGHVAGAWMTDQAVSREPGLLPYIYVSDVAATVDLVVAYGGEIVAAPYAEGNLSVATFRNPAGNVMGLWQEVT
jgi:predicted enzyme related to lactoylglutathione lyase